jgi:hypothetical protein
MKLLLENLSSDLEVLTENLGKQTYLVGPVARSEFKNKNSRLYPKRVLDRAMREYNESCVQTNRGWCELSHPAGTNPGINLDRVCARVVELWPNDNVWRAKALVTSTPSGDLLKGLLASGGAIGSSTRALGSVKEDRGLAANVVQDDLRILAWDCVADPSADCWMSRIDESSYDWHQDAQGNWVRSTNDVYPNNTGYFVDGVAAACLLNERRSALQALADRYGTTSERVGKLFEQARARTRGGSSAATLMLLEQYLVRERRDRSH